MLCSFVVCSFVVCVCVCVSLAPATRLANQLAAGGSKNPVLVLKGACIAMHSTSSESESQLSAGGYERFSAEYPFLRTQKIMYTPMVRNT